MRVEYDENDCEAFAASWPCSTVAGSGFAEFDSEGNLVDLVQEGVPEGTDGPDWVAFIDDLQKRGRDSLTTVADGPRF